MTTPAPVCILTAGKGTRMQALSFMNKALLPFGEKAILSHIIDSFPQGTPFVIALGYQGAQVREYLAAAHPQLSVTFVEVDLLEGEGSGPGYSLFCCREHLQKPFYFIACDTLFQGNLQDQPKGNWIGISAAPQSEQSAYCNVQLQDSRVVALLDKAPTGNQTPAFTGLMFIQDVSLFWSSLAKGKAIAGEHQVSSGLQGLVQESDLQGFTVRWTDLGTYEKYRKAVAETQSYDFGKTNESLYFVDGRVIKFFSDPKIVTARVRKAALKPSIFPKIGYAGSQFYAYPFVAGRTLYTYLSPEIFSQLLSWLQTEVWTPVAVAESDMRRHCHAFYRVKTAERLKAFQKKYPDFVDPLCVNGIPVRPISELLEALPWDELCQGKPVFMHGDLQFDNILYDEASGQFTLIDWRQDFAGNVEFGDLYYDLAKLHGGMILNYDYIKQGLFDFRLENGNLHVDFAQRFLGQTYQKQLEQFVQAAGLNFRRVKQLTGLIYLNMAPLHHPPFDQALYGLGALLLSS